MRYMDLVNYHPHCTVSFSSKVVSKSVNKALSQGPVSLQIGFKPECGIQMTVCDNLLHTEKREMYTCILQAISVVIQP